MRVAIVGSRDWPDPKRVFAYVRKIAEKHPDAVIVSGGARGVDRAAENAAKLSGLDVISYRPRANRYPGDEGTFRIVRLAPLTPGNKFVGSEFVDERVFDSYGKAAYARNELIVRDADVVVAFQHNGSRGTQHSIDLARELGKDVWVHEP